MTSARLKSSDLDFCRNAEMPEELVKNILASSCLIIFDDVGPASRACHSHEPRAAHYETKRHPTIQRTNENNVPLIRMRSDFFAVMTGVSFVFTSCQRTVARDDTRKI